MSKEAFVYLWYDAPNYMYYLGSHKGSPDDSYTHSSTIWESFTKNNIPKGVKRRILAYGTHKEMLALESKLQTNRKKRCWDRYYNDNVCDGVYCGFGLGENHPHWKGGITYDMKAYMKAYSATPKRKEYQKAYQKAYQQTPECKEYQKAYQQTPERKAYKKEYYARKKAEVEAQGEGTLDAFLR